ncbi:MAG TPA: SIS domain-containing protein [Acidobacteriota bacterium]|nr:SIS domain-containing protein [Acidobacteriota bacterium]
MNKINIHLSQVEEGMTLLDQFRVQKVADALKVVKSRGGTVYLCGNGGSHSTASHFANDLTKMCRIKAVCLGDAVPVTTAYGNDDGWENMYSNALVGRITAEDAVIGISCSGNSQNVINALRVGREAEALTIGFTGLSESSNLWHLGVDILIHASVPDIRAQEDIHSICGHAIVRAIQEDE